MTAEPSACFSPGRPPFSILVVDDNEDLRDVLRTLLEKEGYEVTTASDGPEALAALERGLDPGFILLDIMMPKMSGFEVLARIRSDRLRANIPVGMMSGSHEVDPAPSTYFLRKPFDISRLLKIIRRHDCGLPPSVASTIGNVCP